MAPAEAAPSPARRRDGGAPVAPSRPSRELARELGGAALTGVLVGVMDVAVLWPLVTVATRREAGETAAGAVRRGALWSGARTALTMLIPYSVAVEAMTTYARHTTRAETDAQRLLVAPLVSLGIAAGLQPVEKKLVLEQLSSSRPPAAASPRAQTTTHLTLRDMAAYVRAPGGLRALWAGFPALWARESLYVASVTVLNPLATASVSVPQLAAFAVGFGAGMLTAPLQSLNVVCKDDRNRGLRRPWGVLLEQGWSAATLRRVFFGALPRSLRIGGAGVLWYTARQWTGALLGGGEGAQVEA